MNAYWSLPHAIYIDETLDVLHDNSYYHLFGALCIPIISNLGSLLGRSRFENQYDNRTLHWKEIKQENLVLAKSFLNNFVSTESNCCFRALRVKRDNFNKRKQETSYLETYVFYLKYLLENLFPYDYELKDWVAYYVRPIIFIDDAFSSKNKNIIINTTNGSNTTVPGVTFPTNTIITKPLKYFRDDLRDKLSITKKENVIIPVSVEFISSNSSDYLQLCDMLLGISRCSYEKEGHGNNFAIKREIIDHNPFRDKMFEANRKETFEKIDVFHFNY